MRSSLSKAAMRFGNLSSFDAAALNASDFVEYISDELMETPLEKSIMA